MTFVLVWGHGWDACPAARRDDAVDREADDMRRGVRRFHCLELD